MCGESVAYFRENSADARRSEQYDLEPISNPVAAEMEGQEEIKNTVWSLLQVLRLPVTKLHLGRPAMRATQQDFENAMNQVKLLKKDPGNEVKLRLYALYKQVTAWALLELKRVLSKWFL